MVRGRLAIMQDTNQTERRMVREVIRKREQLSTHDSVPVKLISGATAPRLRGSEYWKTAFSRSYPSGKSFSKILYTPSTRRIEVGRVWIERRRIGA